MIMQVLDVSFWFGLFFKMQYRKCFVYLRYMSEHTEKN